MGFAAIDNILQSIDGFFCSICDGVFSCFRFIEIFAQLFSFVHQLVTMFLDLNRVIFTGLFSSVRRSIDYGKSIKLSFSLLINYIHCIVFENFKSITHSTNKLLAKIPETVYNILYCDYQYYFNQFLLSLKDFALDCLDFIGKYCILFTQVIAGISRALFDFCIYCIKNVALFLEKYVDVIGKCLIDILFLKPLYMLASVGDVLFSFVSKSWQTTTDSSYWLASKTTNFCNDIYNVVYPAFVYTGEVISLPFTLTKEIFEYIFGSLCWLAFICFILAVVLLNSNWFYIFVQYLTQSLRNEQGNVNFERNELPPLPPIRNTPQQTTKIRNDSTTGKQDLPDCVVCQDEERTIVILPCKHLCVCQTCFRRLLDMRVYLRNCPLCRTRIEDHINVYL